MKNTLTLILAGSLMLACSGDSKDDADTNTPNVDVVTAEDADTAAEKAMADTESANAELDKLAKELED
ncbi:MAG: hypothetical protein QF489_08840 [Planctomycetota bacterium]|jgi:hypothetical protein|nr:hypothetical protein [Planctomycetota bacterium]